MERKIAYNDVTVEYVSHYSTGIICPLMGELTGTTTQITVELGIIAMKKYSTLTRSPEMKPHYQIYEVHMISFQTFFCKGTFIDSTLMKLESPSK